MDLPKPPDDLELKNIIDKLGNFVARNGPEFEQMTKQKQKDNPKFSFLFGGENYAYYQYRVTTEQAILKQQQQKLVHQQPVVPPVPSAAPVQQTPWQSNVPQNEQTLQLREQLEQQRKASQDQIKQSEQNLADHYKNLIQQQQVQIDDAIAKAREDNFLSLSNECDITVEELDRMSTAIIDSCTKDAISNGKNWIFAHNMSPIHSRLLAEYMHRRIVGTKDVPFETRLHLIYLINDVLHHCMRKNADDLREALENIVIPVFCVSYQAAEEDKKQKLLKLLDLWNKNKYFQDNVLEELRDPPKGLQNYQAHLLSQHPDIVQNVSAEVNQKYSQLQKQHQEFVNHLNSQITSLESNLLAHEQSLAAAAAAAAVANVVPQPAATTAPVQPTYPPPPPPQPTVEVIQGQPPSIPGQPPPSSTPGPQYHAPQPGFGAPALGFPTTAPMPPGMPSNAPPVPQQFDYAHGQNAAPFVQDYGHGQHPPVSSGPPPQPSSFQLPDFSKPPPGFPPLSGGGGMGMGPQHNQGAPGPIPSEADLMPSVPYFDLPAGLMAPLVKLEDSDYKALDPRDMRLPPPQPPSDRLLAAVEAFYSQPSHERPRDGEGWEKLGLYEFFRAKQKAKKMKEQMRRDHSSLSSSSSRSRSSSTSRSRSSSSRSRSRSASRSRSRSPRRRRSRSRSKSRSPPGFRKRRSSSGSSSRSRSRSRTPPPRRRRSRERSETPPSFGNEAFYQTNLDSRLGFDNKGHQLLAKMGWGGGGLGAKEQGRMDPVEAAEARDKVDQFKGLGMSMSDPFEQFRKNKAQGFISRMRARDAASTKQ